MDEQEAQETVDIATSRFTDHLSDDEFTRFMLMVELDFDPREASWWEKIKGLYQVLPDGSQPFMHSSVKEAVRVLYHDRAI